MFYHSAAAAATQYICAGLPVTPSMLNSRVFGAAGAALAMRRSTAGPKSR